MSAPAFTPGPWLADIDGQEVRANHDRMKVCDIRGWGYLTGKGGGLGLDAPAAAKIQLANARLIAAAPALYDAVEALVECFIKRGPFDEPLGSSEQAPSINAGIAALKQARGEL